jgi:hypothetical protein
MSAYFLTASLQADSFQQRNPAVLLDPVFTQLLTHPAQFYPESEGNISAPSATQVTSIQYNHPITELISMAIYLTVYGSTALVDFGRFLGRAAAQAVSRWLPTAAARVRIRAAYGFCGGQSGTEAGFLRVLRFPLPIIPPISPS